MGQYDYLIPGSKTSAPSTKPVASKSSTSAGQYDYLIPKSQGAAPAAPAPIQKSDPFNPFPVKGNQTAQDVQTALSTPTQPKSFLSNIHDTFTSAVAEVEHQADLFGSGDLLQKGAAVVNTGFQALNVLFSPISAALNSAAGVPGVGVVADGLNRAFAAVGAGAGGMARDTIQALPIPQHYKDVLTPLAQEVAGFAAQIELGKFGGDLTPRLKEATSQIAKTTKDIIVSHPATEALHETPAEATIKPSEAPTTSGVVHTAEVPSPTPTQPIAESTKPQTSVPEPSVAEPAPLKALSDSFAKGEIDAPTRSEKLIKSEPTLDQTTADTLVKQATTLREQGATPQAIQDHLTQSLQETVPKASVKEPDAQLPQPLANEAKSTIGKSIEAKAVENGLTKGFSDTAGYDPITIKDQAERATKLVNDNVDQARAIVRGEQPLPEGLRGTSLITAMEEHIAKTRDAQAAYELANSPLVSETSAHAQEMRLMAERVPDSLTAKFKEIKAAREAALEKRGGAKKSIKKITDDINKEIKKTASKRPTWEAFVKEIQCGY